MWPFLLDSSFSKFSKFTHWHFVSVLYSSWWHNIILFGYCIYLFINVDILVVCVYLLLGRRLLWTGYTQLCVGMLWFLLRSFLRGRLLGHKLILCLTISGTAGLFSKLQCHFALLTANHSPWKFKSLNTWQALSHPVCSLALLCYDSRLNMHYLIVNLVLHFFDGYWCWTSSHECIDQLPFNWGTISWGVLAVLTSLSFLFL